MGAPELRQFQVTIYVETHCKHRRKKSIYGLQSRWTEKIIPCKVRLTLSKCTPIGQSRFARLPFLGFHWHFLNYSELLKTGLQTSGLALQLIRPRHVARNKKKRAFTREIHLLISIACNAAVFLGAGESCLLSLCCLCSLNTVAAIFNLNLLLRKIAIGESSIPWNRSPRAKADGGVSRGQLPSIFYNSTWRYASRT